MRPPVRFKKALQVPTEAGRFSHSGLCEFGTWLPKEIPLKRKMPTEYECDGALL